MSNTIINMNENKEQYVYIMSNPSFPEDMLKIGWTREHPNIRANDLHTSGIPTPFIVEYVIITPAGSKLEKQIHNHIKNYRVNSNREFFKISKDELTEILTKVLMLELTPITEITAPINTKMSYGKKVNELKLRYEQLKNESDEFFSKFKKDKSKLVIKEFNNNKRVSIQKIETEYTITPLNFDGFDDDDILRIKNAYIFINRYIIQYKKWIDDLIVNYEEIKNTIGVEQLRRDNKSLKEMILDTQKDLRNLKDEYIWDL
jgi:hypothetical protein